MVTRAKLRVAIAGAGFASALHLAGWRRVPCVEVVAICDPDERKAADRAREFGIAEVYNDAAAMLDAVSPDALDVAAPMSAHVMLCLLAAERGVHVLCQKPLAPSLAEAQALADAMEGRARLMVHENWRFRAHYRRIRQWLEDGTIGEVTAWTMQVRSSGLVAGDDGVRPQLVRQPFCAALSRFMIGETLIHHLDVVRWLVGPLAVVAARIGHGCPAIRGEDRALIVLEGARCWGVVDGNMSVPGFAPNVVDRLEITGARGTIRFEDGHATLAGVQSARESFDLAAGYADSYAVALQHFADGLVHGAPFETDVRDNLHTLALVEDAYAQARVLPVTMT